MALDRIRFAPDLEALGEAEALAALGATSLDDLFRPEGLATWDRAEVSAGGAEIRLPLPGTADAGGRVRERPRGAGTGWVRLRLFETSLPTGLVLRFTHPRSASEAERRWNLACALREAGVTTPDPVAVAARGHGLWSSRSVLVLRDLARSVSLERFLHTELPEEERHLGIEAVGLALARLARGAVVLPRLTPGGIAVQLRGDCGEEAPDGVGGVLRRLPGVAVTDLAGGYLVRSGGHPRSAETYAYLASEVQGLLREEEWSLLEATAGAEALPA
jgi:hypothetical protein